MTALLRPVRRVVARERRNLVVTLFPGTINADAGYAGAQPQIEIREAGRRIGYRVTIATLYTMLATRAAGLGAPRGRRARRIA